VRKKPELFPDSEKVLELRGVVKRYGEATVLDGIDLRVDEGQVVTLIGASGSGKSTLLRCVNLLETVDDGEILLEGTDIADPRLKPGPAQQRMAIVFQAFNLFPHMTALQNVTLARASCTGCRQGGDRARSRAAAPGRLDAFAGAYPDRLSGGQQQRVAIARALAVQPRLLLLDEITSALDPELVGEVLAIVRELARGSSTMLMATHEMGFARQVSDHVVFLDGGRVCEAGPPERVLHDPTEDRTRQFLARVIAAGRLN
jgi:polar amino acid transport system ATP-binding protein